MHEHTYDHDINDALSEAVAIERAAAATLAPRFLFAEGAAAHPDDEKAADHQNNGGKGTGILHGYHLGMGGGAGR